MADTREKATGTEDRGLGGTIKFMPPRRVGPQGVIVHGRKVWELEQDVLIVGKAQKDAARKTAPSNQGLESGKANPPIASVQKKPQLPPLEGPKPEKADRPLPSVQQKPHLPPFASFESGPGFKQIPWRDKIYDAARGIGTGMRLAEPKGTVGFHPLDSNLSYRPAADAYRGIELYYIVGDEFFFNKGTVTPTHVYRSSRYWIVPEVRSTTGEVVAYVAHNPDINRNEWVIGPQDLGSFFEHEWLYAWQASSAYPIFGEPPPYEVQHGRMVNSMFRGDMEGMVKHYGASWAEALHDPGFYVRALGSVVGAGSEAPPGTRGAAQRAKAQRLLNRSLGEAKDELVPVKRSPPSTQPPRSGTPTASGAQRGTTPQSPGTNPPVAATARPFLTANAIREMRARGVRVLTFRTFNPDVVKNQAITPQGKTNPSFGDRVSLVEGFEGANYGPYRLVIERDKVPALYPHPVSPGEYFTPDPIPANEGYWTTSEEVAKAGGE